LFDANTFGANRMLRLTHGTNNANVRHILHERGAGSGLRLPRSYTDGWMFDPGIYFANVASKSAQYCRGSSKHPHMMFLADVAVGEMYLVPTDMGNTREAPKRHHSVWGKPFTAYDVTMILRALFPYPQRELPHYDQHGVPGVQPEIYRQRPATWPQALTRSTAPTPTGWTRPTSTRPTGAVGAPDAGSASPPCSAPATAQRPYPSARG